MKSIEKYRKAVVAFVVGSGAAWAIIEKADLSTKEGVYAFIGAAVNAALVYLVPNQA